jgi:hypothetical protein
MASLGLLTGGTISVSNGATAVTGSGTAFTQAFAGSLLIADGNVVPISVISSDTALTISEAWPGTTLSGAAYSIVLISQAHSLSAQNQQRLQELLNALELKGEIHYVTGAPASGLGDDGDTAIRLDTSAIYRKASGAWTAVWDGVIVSPEIATARVMTQAVYDALATKDINTLYAITAD